MVSTKVMAVLGAAVLCAAAPAAYYFSPVLLAGMGTPSSRITAAINEGLSEDAKLCWGAKQISNVVRYEAGQDAHLVYSHRKIEGFTGALLNRNNKDREALESLVTGGAVGKNPKVEARRVSPAEEVVTAYLTPTKREYWTRGKGFCLGMPRVVELINHTEPAPNSQGVQTIMATFDFDYVNIAEWAKPATVAELKRPKRATARLTVHSKGYSVVEIDR